MKLFRWWFVVSILALPLTGFAQHREDSPLHGEMEAIGRAARQLGRQLDDPAQKASSLELVATMQKHAEKAKTLAPSKADKLTGDDKTKLMANFQAGLDALLKEIAALKEAIAGGKTEDAKAAFQKIQQLRDSNHKALGVESGPGGRRHGGQPPGPPPGQ
jgi:soluble cytochrome b562